MRTLFVGVVTALGIACSSAQPTDDIPLATEPAPAPPAPREDKGEAATRAAAGTRPFVDAGLDAEVDGDAAVGASMDGAGDAGDAGAVAVGERDDGLVDVQIVDCHARNDGLKGAGAPTARVRSIGAALASAQDFSGGYLGPTTCFRKAGAFSAWMVRGDIKQTFDASGGATGALGLPTSDESDGGSGPRQSFERGYVAWDPSTSSYRAFAN